MSVGCIFEHEGMVDNNKCKICSQLRRLHKLKVWKLYFIIKKGGKCEECGYNERLAGLEFHHINTNEKEFDINSGSRKNFEQIESEINKCKLLCSNCHKDTHTLYKIDHNLSMRQTSQNFDTLLYPKLKESDVKVPFVNHKQDGKCQIHKDAKINSGHQCSTCKNLQTKKINYLKKIWCVQKLNSKCMRCNYSKSLSPLEFHHFNTKNFKISDNLNLTKLNSEIKFCQLLCKRCHNNEHESYFINLDLRLTTKQDDSIIKLIKIYDKNPEELLSQISLKPMKLEKEKKERFNIKKFYTEEKITELRTLIKNNTLEEVGKILNISGNAVRSRCLQLQIELPNNSERMRSKNISTLRRNALSLKRYTEQLKGKPSLNRKHNYEKITELINKGYKRKEIQKILNIKSRRSLYDIIKILKSKNLINKDF